MSLRHEPIISCWRWPQGMGATGVGSQLYVDQLSPMWQIAHGSMIPFINRASGSYLKEGDDLDSCMSKISRSDTFELRGHTIQLIDMPAFNDSGISNTQVLRKIVLFLKMVWILLPTSTVYLIDFFLDIHRGFAFMTFSIFIFLMSEWETLLRRISCCFFQVVQLIRIQECHCGYLLEWGIPKDW